ncbi:MAG: aspartate aminotransferase family protein, partial [Prochlorococcus sp.]
TATTQHRDGDAGARWSVQTRQTLIDHQLMVSRPLYQGRHHLKIVLGNPHTQTCHLNLLAELLNQSIQGLG